MNAKTLLKRVFPSEKVRANVHHIEHHLAHLASAFYVSPFREAVAVSVDGFGDFSSSAWGRGIDTDISIENRVHFPHSLGIFYQAMTQFLGFPHYGDEYKVMGLAPYGEPAFMSEMRELVQCCPDGRFRLNTDYFRHHREPIAYEWNDGAPVFGELFSEKLAQLLGIPRRREGVLERSHMNLARSVQAMYEEAFFNMISAAGADGSLKDIVLAGGCANNSVANGKILRHTEYRRVYVHAAPGDAGGAIGAAFAVWHAQGGQRGFVMDHAYWGPSFDNDACSAVLKARAIELENADCAVASLAASNELCRRAASAVAEGKVVGWFQGRMEWGPRALGNRSIICDPRRADMKAILNSKIKRRESFRPFAPSVLAEYQNEWFEENDSVPFMTQVFQLREDKRSKVPAVTHVDGSGRLHTVTRASNPRYADLISAFRHLTGVPMVLNTSFNENEPVVCRPEEALDCFLRTQMDLLVLNDWVISRKS